MPLPARDIDPPAREKEGYSVVSPQEIERRYRNIRAQMHAEKVDALVVCGSEYTGFEGAVRYVSDFEIVHRYACVLSHSSRNTSPNQTSCHFPPVKKWWRWMPTVL